MKIISATTSNLNRIITLHKQLSLPNPPNDYVWDKPSWIKQEIEERNFWTLKIRNRNRNYTQGAICLQLDFLEDPDEAYIASLVIDPNYHKKGLGKKLVEFAKTRAKKAGKRLLTVESLCKYHATGFYKKCGFRCSPKTGYYHGYPFFSFYMKL